MRVLFVIHYPVFGGPHNQAVLLQRGLARHGSDLVVLLPAGASDAAERLRAADLDVVSVPLQRFRASKNPITHLRSFGTFARDVRSLRQVIRTHGIEVVQLGGLINPHAALAARLEDRPVVWQILDTRAPMSIRRVLMPLVVRWSDVVMTTGRAVAEAHPGTSGLGERLRVFYPAVDLALFSHDRVDRDAVRAEWGFGPEDRVVGTVGNLNPQKGHEYLVRAVGLVQASTPSVKLVVVGASHETHRSYEEHLHRLADRLGLAVGRDVVFTGGVADVRPALAAFDVFALASVPRSEGTPNAILEAMAMQLPVVATDVGAVSEIVDDGGTGFVVPPEDPAALADAIKRVLEVDRSWDELGLRARDLVAERFSIDEYARVHREAYRHALRLASERRSLRTG